MFQFIPLIRRIINITARLLRLNHYLTSLEIFYCIVFEPKSNCKVKLSQSTMYLPYSINKEMFP